MAHLNKMRVRQPVKASPGSVGVAPAAEHCHTCETSIRDPERAIRPFFDVGLKRLEIGKRSIRDPARAIRPFFDRPIRVLNESSPASVLQLEARSNGVDSGRTVSLLEETQHLHVPSTFPHPTMPLQVESGEGVRPADRWKNAGKPQKGTKV